MIIKMLQNKAGSWDYPSILLAAMTLMIGISFGWALYEILLDGQPPIMYLNAPFPVDKTQYKGGDLMILTVEQERYTDASVTVHRHWHCGEFILHEISVIGGGEKGYSKNMLPLTVPDILPAGKCQLDFRMIFHVNPLADRTVEVSSISFEILK